MLFDEDGVDEGGNLGSEGDEDLEVPQCALIESRRSSDRVRSSSGCGVARAKDEDRATWKCSALLPLWRPSLKHHCVINDGSQGLLSSVLFGPSFVRFMASGSMEDADKELEAIAVIRAQVVSSAYGPTMLGAATQVAISLPRRGVTRLIMSSSTGSSKRYVIPWFFSLAMEPRLFDFYFFRVF